jgi:hypothetical protein
LPSNETFGSGGEIILFPGNATDMPNSFGIGSGVLWYTTASNGTHSFYTGTPKNEY